MTLETVAFQDVVRFAHGGTMSTVTAELREVKWFTQGPTTPTWQRSDGVSSHQSSALCLLLPALCPTLRLPADASALTRKRESSVLQASPRA